MRIYIAAPWEHRKEAALAAIALRNAGFTITSRWYDEPNNSILPMTAYHEALQDLSDIGCAQTLLVLNFAYSEGKAVETGYALHAGLAIIVVGERTNIFHYHPRVRLVSSLDAAIEVLSTMLPLPGVPSHETTIPSNPPIRISGGGYMHGEPLDPPPSFRGTLLQE